MPDLLDDLVCYKKTRITHDGKLTFFLGKHSTKEGTWGKLHLHAGEVDFVFLNGEGEEISRRRLNKDNPHMLIPPASWHKLVQITPEFDASLDFCCKPHRYFNKKYKQLSNVHQDLLYVYKTYFKNQDVLNVLDVGCGSGRNSLFLAFSGHRVTGIDINEESIQQIREIAEQENITTINTIVHDLNLPLTEHKELYDFVISTVSLQFLQVDRIPSLLKELRAITAAQGLHILVFPISSAQFTLPSSFTYLPESDALYHDYQSAGWSVLEYTETIGQLHKTDVTGKPIQGLFGLLLAQRA